MAIAKIVYKESAEATPVVWMDTTDKTAAAGNMLSGTTALKNDGTTATGNIATKTSANLSASGATVTAPAGYYASDASKSVATGTAGTPTATKGTVSNHAVSVTPSVTNTAGYISGGNKTGTAVSVSASELVSGTKSITASGTTDVTNYESASVAAGSAATPATSITANPSISVSSGGLITATASATKSVTPTVSAGYVGSGTAGTITVSGSNTQQLTTQAAATITPTTSSQTAVAAGKYTTGAVTVAAIPSEYIIPSGTVSITDNGTVDVSQYASAEVSVSGGGGLEYEEGTFTPSEDVAKPTIYFSNTHTSRPFFITIADVGATTPDASSAVVWNFVSYYDVFGSPYNISGILYYAIIPYRYKTSSSDTGSTFRINTLSNTGTNVCFQYWVSESAFYPEGNNSTYRSGRTYKWIAVWTPTT